MLYQIKNFRKTVTTAGTREQMTSSGVKPGAVVIQALRTNTNNIFVGDNQVSSSVHFTSLAPGGSITIGLDPYGQGNALVDLSQIFLDVTTSGEGVVYGFLDRKSDD